MNDTQQDLIDKLRRKPYQDIDWHSDGLFIATDSPFIRGTIYAEREPDDPFWKTFYEETGWSREALLKESERRSNETTK